MEATGSPAVAVLGAGGVGCFFGGMLARSGAPVTFIGRQQHVDAMSRNGLLFESAGTCHIVPVRASTDPAAAREAGLILLSVKTPDTEVAVRSLAPYLAQDAMVLSLQNGVDNVERIRSATGLEAIAAAVYVGAEMVAPGHVKHTARGDLVIGELPDGNRAGNKREHRVERLAARFAGAGVPCRVSQRLETDLWAKLIMNCAYNAISAVGQVRYGRIVNNQYTREIIRLVVLEVLAVARAAGIDMGEGDPVESALALAATMPEVMSSTAQDISRGKQTEIDALNGYVARRGKELGIPTPVNQTLHALVKLIEERN